MTELENLGRTPAVLTTQHLEGAYKLSSNNDKRYANCYAVHPRYNHAAFDEKFKKKFGTLPGVYAAEGYDAAQFLARATHAGGINKPGFAYEGLKGSYSYTPGQNGLLKDKAILVQMKGGAMREIP